MKTQRIVSHIALVVAIGIAHQAHAQLLGGRLGGSVGGSLGGAGLGRMNTMSDLRSEGRLIRDTADGMRGNAAGTLGAQREPMPASGGSASARADGSASAGIDGSAAAGAVRGTAMQTRDRLADAGGAAAGSAGGAIRSMRDGAPGVQGSVTVDGGAGGAVSGGSAAGGTGSTAGSAAASGGATQR